MMMVVKILVFVNMILEVMVVQIHVKCVPREWIWLVWLVRLVFSSSCHEILHESGVIQAKDSRRVLICSNTSR